ncbi:MULTISPECIES: digeranylgeranylglycerophospholipid reductase [unclassified Methanosarcina]|uniref:digeranylgeranylglycerophospholipid reductase n=1 Tax=unclassified Methanosarcina TaxID=2644672 RepID=UPI000616101D|nr:MULTISPECIES: digeranylgeranylglycerophospholipid reductase [unclassified Methanosarcina]AKB18277.1 Digeranylgeranylglycerophospholipid reductase [Methanosarcina sp. WWM596]AKB21601.1 Digeranylgeranylglycerophospholipid reductase [Methanosarcina sp. WH1]
MKERYDIIVVGAGPAGSIAAKTAAEKGLDVLLIEKRQEIGAPVRCAEGVSKEFLRKHVEIDKRWVCADVNGSRVYAPDGTKVEMTEKLSGKEVGFVLERKVFDLALAELAAKAGAEVRVRTRATDLIIEDRFVKGARLMHLGKEYEVRADIVIGADGIESKVGRWAGIDTSLKPADIETCVQYLVAGVDIDQECCEFYLGNEISPGGYVWVFPKGEGKANVGIGILGSKGGKFKPRPVDYLNKFVEKHFPEGKIVEMVFGGVPVSGNIEKFTANGLMLIGDAARQSDPITGGGILNGMDAGKMAGEAAYEAISTGDVSEEKLEELYEKRWKTGVGKKIDTNLIVKNCFVNLSDEDLNSLAHSVKDVKFESMRLLDLLFALFKANRKLLWDLHVLFKDVAIEAAKNRF